MKLKWYGTAALLIFDNETVLAFDPFFGIRRGEMNPGNVLIKDAGLSLLVSDVFVTHGHFDHIIQIPAVFLGGRTVVHATATPCDTLKNCGMPERQLDNIAPGWSGCFGNIKITAFQGRHCVFDTPLVVRTALRFLKPGNLTHGLRLLRYNREYPENGETLFYELESGGKRLQIMGSMGLDPEVNYPTGADLLILPYQGKSNPVEYAASLVERLQPKEVLLDHYDDSFPPMTARVKTADFEKYISQKGKIPCRAMKRVITYDLEDFPHEQGKTRDEGKGKAGKEAG